VESGDLRGLWSGARQCQASVVSASPTTSRSVGSSLRPPRPSTVTGPGPSRTWSGGRIGVQAPFIGLRIVTTLLRSVRTTAGSLAAHRLEPKLRPGDQDPASPGVRDLSAPPPTHPTRIHSQEPELPRVPFGPTAPPVQHPVPSSWFHTTSAVFSARRPAGLLHPAAGPEVRRVSRNPLPRRPLTAPLARRGDRPEGQSGAAGVRKASSPRRDLYPSKSSPRPQPYRVTTADAPLPLDPTRR
jgi:hypothetical protein